MNKYKYLLIGLSLIMFLALVGCNNKDNNISSKHEDVFINTKKIFIHMHQLAILSILCIKNMSMLNRKQIRKF
ncbi:hypothetical protein [Thomasclavelia cocleata]|uniref:hypothetical protein n=1 Tax=Thomasclavelia cocleata TaxID=69824 RepID=UPI00255A87D8|nr:hypothetical protein [Thomasclavelia cocleata]